MAKANPPPSEPTALQTLHVFLDTEVYRQLGHNPDNPVLNVLGDHIENSALILHVTDITLAEIRRQLSDFVTKTTSALKTARKEYGRWRHRLPSVVPNDLPTFDETAVAAAAFDAIHNAIRYRWNATLHAATNVLASMIFEDYFARRPPFEGQASKEFPDAFVVKCLEQWCAQHDERMYVVTADKAMTDAVKNAPHLIPVQALADLFASIAATETPDIVQKAEALLARTRIGQAIQTAVEENISDLIPIYNGDLADGEVTDHELNGEVQLVDFRVVAVSDEDVSLMMEIKTPLLIHIEYDDRSDAIYDKEDDIYFGAETATTQFEDEPTVRVFARFSFKPTKLKALRLLTNEFHVSDPVDYYS